MNDINIEPIASFCECNFGGIEIGNVTDESLYWRYNWGEDNITKWEEAEIEYSPVDNDGEVFADEEGNPDSQPYFTIGNVDEEGREWKYFLNMFLRYGD